MAGIATMWYKPESLDRVKGVIRFMMWNEFRKNALKSVLLTACLLGGAQVLSAQTAGEVWKDSATGLTWTAKDNGGAVNHAQAQEYCKELRTGGFSDWRLPTIDELETVYDKGSKKLYKLKGNIELGDSCALSATTNPSGEVWNFCFNYGGRTVTRAAGHGSAGRALCVRKSE